MELFELIQRNTIRSSRRFTNFQSDQFGVQFFQAWCEQIEQPHRNVFGGWINVLKSGEFVQEFSFESIANFFELFFDIIKNNHLVIFAVNFADNFPSVIMLLAFAVFPTHGVTGVDVILDFASVVLISHHD